MGDKQTMFLFDFFSWQTKHEVCFGLILCLNFIDRQCQLDCDLARISPKKSETVSGGDDLDIANR